MQWRVHSLDASVSDVDLILSEPAISVAHAQPGISGAGDV